jgi:hypothetical protein
MFCNVTICSILYLALNPIRGILKGKKYLTIITLIIDYTRPKGLFHIIKYCEASPPPQGSFICDAWRFLVLDLFHDSHPCGWSLFLTFFLSQHGMRVVGEMSPFATFAKIHQK